MQDSLNDMRREVEESNREEAVAVPEEEMEKLALRTQLRPLQRVWGTGFAHANTSSKKIDHANADTDSSSSEDSSDDEPQFLRETMKSFNKQTKSFAKSVRRVTNRMGITSLEKSRSCQPKLKRLRDMAR